MKIKEIVERIDNIIPLKLAQDWDNVGLLIGDPNKDVKNILLTIDITKAVISEAKKQKAELIISYHPVIWDGLKIITTDCPTDIVYDLIRSGIAVFSIHTALDVVTGGVNDGLAEIIGIRNAKPIGDYIDYLEGDNYKLVVFVPSK
jgi:dinuclear metal center YbgI/SA1388 family protein